MAMGRSFYCENSFKLAVWSCADGYGDEWKLYIVCRIYSVMSTNIYDPRKEYGKAQIWRFLILCVSIYLSSFFVTRSAYKPSVTNVIHKFKSNCCYRPILFGNGAMKNKKYDNYRDDKLASCTCYWTVEHMNSY